MSFAPARKGTKRCWWRLQAVLVMASTRWCRQVGRKSAKHRSRMQAGLFFSVLEGTAYLCRCSMPVPPSVRPWMLARVHAPCLHLQAHVFTCTRTTNRTPRANRQSCISVQAVPSEVEKSRVPAATDCQLVVWIRATERTLFGRLGPARLANAHLGGSRNAAPGE